MIHNPDSFASKIGWLEARIERLEEAVPRLEGAERDRILARIKQLTDRRDMLSARQEHIQNFGWSLGTPLEGAEFSYEALKESMSRMMTRWL